MLANVLVDLGNEHFDVCANRRGVRAIKVLVRPHAFACAFGILLHTVPELLHLLVAKAEADLFAVSHTRQEMLAENLLHVVGSTTWWTLLVGPCLLLCGRLPLDFDFGRHDGGECKR